MDSSSAEQFDFLIIGGGQAGIPLSHALAGAGHRVALAERKHLGGSCVNFGCTPTKAAFASTRLAHQARRAAAYGLRTQAVEVDVAAVMDRARSIREASRQRLQEGFAGEGAPVLLRGHARLTGRTAGGFRLEVGTATVEARQVVLNTGTRTRFPDLDGLDALDVLHAGNWIERDVCPGHLLVLGGGYIGLEMAQFYRRLGSAVTVVHDGDRVAPREDPDVSEAVERLLEAEGIAFRLSAEAVGVEAAESGLHLHLGGGAALEGSHLFVATGRRPNTDDLGLDTVGLTPDEAGFLPIDARLSTPVEGLWAAGDVRGGPMFTHTAYDDFRILRSQLLGDGARTTERVVPYALFTDPALGRVGLTEHDARAQGYDVAATTFALAHNGKAAQIGETDGFVKVVADRATGRLLGAAVLAPEGAELVHAYIALMNAGAPVATLRDQALHIHPTLSEALQTALDALPLP